MATLVRHIEHLPPDGPLAQSRADVELQLNGAVFPVHREYLENQSWVLQGLFESHPTQNTDQIPRLQLGSTATAGGAAIASEAQKALQENQLARFLYQAYHPEATLSADLGESNILDLLAAADFFSDDPLISKCDEALAAIATRRLQGLRDPLPLAIDSPRQPRISSLQLEDSARTVLKQHGSPVKPAQDEWGAEVHALMANNVMARDREELVRYMRLAHKFGLQHLTAACLPHLCKLIVAASSHTNLRHTVQECLPLLDDPAKTVVLFEVAQLAAAAVGDEGLRAWQLDSGRLLCKLREFESQEASLSRRASAAE